MSVLAAAPAASVSPPTAFARIWRVVRVHYLYPTNSLIVPWSVLGFIFIVDLTIWWLISYSSHGTADIASGTQYTGSIFFVLIYSLVYAVQAMNQTFTFALGFTSTRRDYYLGTALMFLIHAASFSIGVTVLSYLEQWTHGWGVGGHLFQTIYFGTGPLWQRLFSFFFALLGCLFLGSIFGAVFVRWRAIGLLMLGAVVLLIIVGVLAGITFTHSWTSAGNWFAHTRSVGLAAWSIPVTAVCAVVGFLALRRAVPRD